MSWKKYRLGDILKRRKEAAKILPIKEYKLVTIKLYHKGVILRNTSKGSEIKSNMSFVHEGDFILSGIDARNGAFGIVPHELEGAVITNDFWCLDPDVNLIDRDFLLFLTGTDFFDFICKQSSDGTTQRIRLQKDKFFNFEIELPTVSEQQALVTTLRSTETRSNLLREELTHQLDLVKQLRQAFLREAMQGKLVPQDPNDEPARELLKKIKAEKEQLIKEGKLKKEKELPPIKPEEIPFEIPKNWVWCRLGELIELYSGQDLEPNLYSDSDRRGIPYITGASNLLDGTIIENRWTRTPKSIARKGDLLLTCKGSGVGKMAFLSIQEAHIARQIMALRSSFVPLTYLKVIIDLETPNFKLKAKSLIPGIDRNLVLKTPCPLPPYSEQHRIVAKLEQLMRYCDELEQSIKRSQIQNEQLLQQVLREALRPKSHYKMNDELISAAEG